MTPTFSETDCQRRARELPVHARHMPALLQYPIAVPKRDRSRINTHSLRQQLATALSAMLRPFIRNKKSSHGAYPNQSVPYNMEKICSLALSRICR